MDFDEAIALIRAVRGWGAVSLVDLLKMRCVWAVCPQDGEQWAFVPLDGWTWPQRIVCPVCGHRDLRSQRWLEWNE